MNLTISVDDDLLRRAREFARRRGTSLQAILREHLRSLVGDRHPEALAEELDGLLSSQGGRSGSRKIHRGEAYQARQ